MSLMSLQSRQANNTQLHSFNDAISGIKDLFTVVENGDSIHNEL